MKRNKRFGNEKNKGAEFKTLDQAAKWSNFKPKSEDEIKECYEMLCKGNEMDKDHKGRPQRVDSLPDKIKIWWEQKKKLDKK